MSSRLPLASIPRGWVCGIEIAAVTPHQAAVLIVEAAAAREPLQVHLCNAYTLSLVDRDLELRHALRRADLNLADGTPVAFMLRRRGARGPVRGPALVPAVAKLGAPRGLRHYLWGGGSGVATEVAERLGEIDPTIVVVGCQTPPYADLDDEEVRAVAARVEAARADVLWVGLGTPRQDYLVPRISPLVNCPVVPVGAAFDFLAGRKPEAPRLLRGSGLEWLHRLISEPRRLWRRYLFGNPRFILSATRHSLSRTRP
jgi:N-acetylglucosaminyldiphosphoundecaprenol N-acetyl-beta-D-mannosaminyltransferase